MLRRWDCEGADAKVSVGSKGFRARLVEEAEGSSKGFSGASDGASIDSA